MIKTIDDTKIDINLWRDSYSYQEFFTNRLDELDGDFDQSVINEIVLWKVNRYALISQETMDLLNQIKSTDKERNFKLTRKTLRSLLNTKGVRLPMASTILRFKNPNVYQLLDQRVFRFIFGEEKKMIWMTSSDKKIEEIIDCYEEYLDRLKKVCKRYKIPFNESDRLLYQADKMENKKSKIK